MSKQADRPKPKLWTDQEREYIAANYGNLSIDEISAHLGRTRGAVKQYATVNDLTQMNHWTQGECDFLREQYAVMTYRQIATRLGRTYRAVCAQAQALGLAESVQRTEKARQVRSDKVTSPLAELIAPARERQYGVGPAHAKVYLIVDRPARLERHDLRPSDANFASGALLSVAI